MESSDFFPSLLWSRSIKAVRQGSILWTQLRLVLLVSVRCFDLPFHVRHLGLSRHRHVQQFLEDDSRRYFLLNLLRPLRNDPGILLVLFRWTRVPISALGRNWTSTSFEKNLHWKNHKGAVLADFYCHGYLVQSWKRFLHHWCGM